jgi:hypothetical protein
MSVIKIILCLQFSNLFSFFGLKIDLHHQNKSEFSKLENEKKNNTNRKKCQRMIICQAQLKLFFL